MSRRVFRIQDAVGRGPFRPGFSRFWSDEEFAPGMQPLPTLMEEFGADIIDRKGRPGEYFGTAVRAIDQLNRWFSPAEQFRLMSLDFNIVSMRINRVLAESQIQLVFARNMPLSHAIMIVPWTAAQVAS